VPMRALLLVRACAAVKEVGAQHGARMREVEDTGKGGDKEKHNTRQLP